MLVELGSIVLLFTFIFGACYFIYGKGEEK